MREATSVSDIPQAYLDNMQQCHVCYIRFEALVDAVKTRQGGD